MSNSRGFALIVVLWFLVLIAAISAYLIADARQETAIARNIMSAANAEALADAGVAQTVFNQTNPAESARWALDGAPHVIRLADGDVSIRLTDERQKINPNRASDTLIAALLEASGIERPLARRIGASVADWVDRDNDPRLLGAEREQYASAGRSYAPPNLPFENLDELQLVLGMTPEIYTLVRPYLTLFSNAPTPDAKTAPPIIQRALRIAPPSSVALQGETIESNPSVQNAELTADQRAAAEEAEVEAAMDDMMERSPVIAMDVTARSSSRGVFVRHAVLRIDSSAPKGYIVLDWRRGDLPVAP